MQFKHPELLYALFLLLIPVFIHLFQLRRFEKVPFTNVVFLKKVTLQTRKSSQLKKWLTLLTRLIALAGIIIAFSQPFSASKTALKTEKETVIYVDNSFSMQVKGNDGILLQKAIQELYKQSGIKNLSWFTNNYSKKNGTEQDFKNEILSIDYSQNQLSPNEIILKAKQLFSNSKTAEKRLIWISDFQQKGAHTLIGDFISENIQIDAVPLSTKITNNIRIDTSYIRNKKLFVSITSHALIANTIPLSLYDNTSLIAKTAVDFSNEKTKTISFEIDTEKIINGKLEVLDSNLLFDNSLYFNINTPEKINVLVLNESKSANFLQRIYNNEAFDFKQQSTDNLNYSGFFEQNLIIINELTTLPESLQTALISFADKGGNILIIPSKKGNTEHYNRLLAGLELGSLSKLETKEKKISQIAFNHPLFMDVFEKQVSNFQYPKVNSFYPVTTQAAVILKYENHKPFLVKKNNCYLLSAALNTENSNFQYSPLIVPTFYKIAQLSLPLPKLYYEIGTQNTFAIPVKLVQDEILTISDSTLQFIPLQQVKENKVLISTESMPSKSGIFSITKNQELIGKVSYNYQRDESVLLYSNPSNWEGIKVHQSIDSLFTAINTDNTIHSYWKWFAIFALLFLIIEMLILKLYK